MATALDEPMAVGLMAKEKPKNQPVRLATDVLESARIVAALRNEPMMDMLSDILRPILAEMEQQELAKRMRSEHPGREHPEPKKPKGKGGPK